MKHYIKLFSTILLLGLILAGCMSNDNQSKDKMGTIKTGIARSTVFALVSSAENSTTDYTKQYSYIEDIGDGRGYTGGIIGFTSGTGDMLAVVKKYTHLRPRNNILAKYLLALKKVNGSASHKGLGKNFIVAWKKAADDSRFIKAQDAILNEQYMQPALKYSKKDHLGQLGQYIYYDALVVHGPGTPKEKNTFQGIRHQALKYAKSPSEGGSQHAYLLAFLRARKPIMREEQAHHDLSRLNTQRQFIEDKNYSLKLPLKWKMYGDTYSLTKKQAADFLQKTQ
ncbi:chitosanase [Pediococcus claussenii]|uniref:Chitosanase n=1 Tax=Pediococcus claussenii (strain ATCC BAA-344 / DSM 14800 / JCM 18046 / KCTC 3811 / LMG 21948 / P06) TaxID=701521 RepID=G8PBX7_PEDCP|nr:chitosanase [Pediococcus claussenii]AEV96035.1 chitosanase [Pediococcus claussenii ATCC BAA-344]ANZ69519.1 chitosanase [Pediococcus claussenii]ANZ71338.1 chitosanase [Pediococcus claussenii]KRN19440.1 csn protein [Pediococcus claussenii]